MSFANTLLPLAIGLAFSCALMTVLWQVQRKTGNAGIVDVAWAAMVGLLGVIYAVWPTGIGWLRGLAATMYAVWSLRLTWYLFRRVVGHPEEGRYRKLREDYGKDADRRFFSVLSNAGRRGVVFCAAGDGDLPIGGTTRRLVGRSGGGSLAGWRAWRGDCRSSVGAVQGERRQSR